MKTEGFPAIEQRVRLIIEASGARAVQLPVTVKAHGEDGRIRVRVNARTPGAEIAPGIPVTLEYVKGGAVYRLKASIARTEEAEVTLAVEDVRKIQRRRHTRLYVSMPVEFSIGAPGGRAASFSGQVRQIGPEGLGMLTDLALKQGDGVSVQLKLDEQPLTVKGNVVWAGGPDMLADSGKGDFSHAVGISFSPMDPDSRGHLDNYLLNTMQTQRG
jgi:hypothetical protein